MRSLRRIILDTDPGIDDALAILLALASPEIELAGVTVTGGNCTMTQGVRNARAILHTANSPVPVLPGVALPLIRSPFTAPETHGDSGLGNARLPEPPGQPSTEHAVDFMIREIMAAPEPITLVAVAPLTNVAMAIRREPRLVERIHEVIIMGGAIDVPGNTTPLAEFNIYVDPHAAHIVFHSGLPIVLLPWDITSKVLMMQDHVDTLLDIDSPVTRLIADSTSFYIDFHREYFGYAGCSINDPCAVAMVYRPDLVETEMVYVDVEISSERSMAKTIADVNKVWSQTPNMRLVRNFDTESFMSLFMQRMQQLARRNPSTL